MSSCCCCIFTGLFRCGRAWKRAKFSFGSRWLITRTVLSHVLAVLWRDFSDVEVRKRVKFSLIKSWLIILSSELVRGMQSCPLVVAVLLLRHMVHAGSSEKATLEATRVGLRYKTDSKRTGQDRGDGVRTCFSIRFAWRTSGFEYSSLRTSRTTGREKGPAVSLLVAGVVCVNWRWGNAGSAVSDTSMSVRPFFFFSPLWVRVRQPFTRTLLAVGDEIANNATLCFCHMTTEEKRYRRRMFNTALGWENRALAAENNLPVSVSSRFLVFPVRHDRPCALPWYCWLSWRWT